MNKKVFLEELRNWMEEFSMEQIERTLSYYEEIISDKMEEGMTEEEAVRSLGSPEEIVKEMLLELPIPTLIGERLKPKKGLAFWQMGLMAVGGVIVFPILFSLIMAAFSVYLSIWMVVAALYFTVAAIGVSGMAALVGATVMTFRGEVLQGIFGLGAFFVLAGLTILISLGMRTVTGKFAGLSMKYVRMIKRKILGRRRSYEK